MSRVGAKPIPIPPGVRVAVADGNEITVAGPGGQVQLAQRIHPAIQVDLDASEVRVRRPSDSRQHRALHGLSRALIANMVQGVTQGFEKRLEVNGLGYRATMQGKTLELQLGFSHPCRFEPPQGVTVEVQGNQIAVRGPDKQVVGQAAADIRKLRPVSVYRSKGTDVRGIRYVGEYVRFKAGKAGKVGA